jgi:hypothetical protein
MKNNIHKLRIKRKKREVRLLRGAFGGITDSLIGSLTGAGIEIKMNERQLENVYSDYKRSTVLGTL